MSQASGTHVIHSHGVRDAKDAMRDVHDVFGIGQGVRRNHRILDSHGGGALGDRTRTTTRAASLGHILGNGGGSAHGGEEPRGTRVVRMVVRMVPWDTPDVLQRNLDPGGGDVPSDASQGVADAPGSGCSCPPRSWLGARSAGRKTMKTTTCFSFSDGDREAGTIINGGALEYAT